jgi:nickel/cobalt exporter
MNLEIRILMITAASIGFFHTLFGPDHYLPFIVMSRARKWSLSRTAWITLLCGIGHVGSSVILGGIGIILGIAVSKLQIFESFRGNLAAWALIAFGLVYFVWGLRKAIRNRPHNHVHTHGNSELHEHSHTPIGKHGHVHEDGRSNITPWILFTVFVFGPCEPLIPILMYPAATKSIVGLVLITTIFASITIITMLGIVLLASWGVKLIPLGKIERYSHALAGATILLSGLAIQFLGL